MKKGDRVAVSEFKEVTPCGALFSIMKKHGGISYKELASLILSGRPLSDGRSPASRVNDRTWISRFLVHAPVGTIQSRYFCDFGTAALRVTARLKSREGRALSSADILDIVCGERGVVMERALAACHQDTALYRNVLSRLSGGDGSAVNEQAESAVVMLVACGCSANVRASATYALDFSHTVRGRRLTTIPVTPSSTSSRTRPVISAIDPDPVLGLLRVRDGYVVGAPHWLSTEPDGSEIGAFAVSEGSITDVGPLVSGRHARVWRASDGRWLVEDLGSTNGTVIIDGATGERVPVMPTARKAGAPSAEEGGAAGAGAEGQGEVVLEATSGDGCAPDAALSEVAGPREIHAGDRLVLAGDTTYLVLEGMPHA